MNLLGYQLIKSSSSFSARQRVLDAAASVVDLVEDYEEDEEQPASKTQVGAL